MYSLCAHPLLPIMMAEAPTHSPEAMKFNASGIAIGMLVCNTVKAKIGKQSGCLPRKQKNSMSVVEG